LSFSFANITLKKIFILAINFIALSFGINHLRSCFMSRFVYSILCAVFLSATACTRYFAPQQQQARLLAVTDTVTAAETPTAKRVAAYVKPYHDSLETGMNTTLVQISKRLVKNKPESEMGNLLCDLFKEIGSEKYGKPIDVALTNFGGIRTEWQAGNITVGNVYEVMPFDNALVVLTLSGSQLKSFLAELAKRKDPQAGVKLTIDRQTDQVIEALVGGKPVDEQQTYTLITSDYVATSSEYAAVLKNPANFQVLNYLMRDAILDYLRRKGQQNVVLDPQKDGRTVVR
jgi:2',3'-cyclic-nucleotide 2'-phosphodiesterase (5'-nucleotidase family)